MLLMQKTIGTVAVMGGVPAILEGFVRSYKNLILWNSQYVCGAGEAIHYPDPPGLSIHDVARNGIAEDMRGDWLLMLDSDHVFEPDLLGRLMNVADRTGADVVTGIYQFRQPPHSPVLYRLRDDTFRPIGDWDRAVDALEVDGAGAGCLWVRRGVFDRIRDELKEPPFRRDNHHGEDLSFFRRLGRLGVKVVCATKVECHHIQMRALSVADYDTAGLELDDPEDAKGYS